MAAAKRRSSSDPSQMRGLLDVPTFSDNSFSAASPQDARPSQKNVQHPGIKRASCVRQKRQQLADDCAEQPPPLQEDDVCRSRFSKSQQLQEDQGGGGREDEGRRFERC